MLSIFINSFLMLLICFIPYIIIFLVIFIPIKIFKIDISSKKPHYFLRFLFIILFYVLSIFITFKAFVYYAELDFSVRITSPYIWITFVIIGNLIPCIILSTYIFFIIKFQKNKQSYFPKIFDLLADIFPIFITFSLILFLHLKIL